MRETINTMISEETISKRLDEIAAEVNRDYAGRTVHVVGVLKGGIFVMVELVRRLTVPVTMDFMSVSSYGNETSSSGIVKITKDLDEPLEGKDVLVVEDIIDSGRTLSYLLNLLKDRKPASLRLMTLLHKPARRVVDVPIDYTGFEIEDKFVVGCGMDYMQRYRNLPFVGLVELEEK